MLQYSHIEKGLVMKQKQRSLEFLLSCLEGLNIRAKKIFLYYRLSCDDEVVGWFSDGVLKLRDVGLGYLPGTIYRPGPAALVNEVRIEAIYFEAEWLRRAILETAAYQKAHRRIYQA
jgi:hypothetical protein